MRINTFLYSTILSSIFLITMVGCDQVGNSDHGHSHSKAPTSQDSDSKNKDSSTTHKSID